MEPLESRTHSFILKLWSEEGAAGENGKAWRGYITHIPDDARCYVKSIDEVVAYLVPYLESMGAKVRLPCRLLEWWGTRWLKR